LEVDYEQELNDYVIRARLGIEVEDFLRSTVGRYLHQRAKIDYEDAKEELLACDLTSREGRENATKAQHKANVANTFIRYCAEAIQDGFAAEKELNREEQGE